LLFVSAFYNRGNHFKLSLVGFMGKLNYSTKVITFTPGSIT